MTTEECVHDYENVPLLADMTTEECVRLITKALAKIGLTSPLKFFIYLESPRSTIAKRHQDFFMDKDSRKNENGEDKYIYHIVYSVVEDIPGDLMKPKSQIADSSILESLQNLFDRVMNGEYQGQKLVLISGDQGYREMVDELRRNGVEVLFLKPRDVGFYVELTSAALSANIDTCFKGDPNWQVVIKSKEQILKESRANFFQKLCLYDLSDQVSGEITTNGSVYQEILSRDPLFTVGNFVTNFRRAIKPSFTACSKGDAEELEKYWSREYIERWKAKLEDFKNKVYFCHYHIQNISDVRVEEIKTMNG